MQVTTSSDLDVDDTVHKVDPELHTTSEDEMAGWGYLMTQYNLEPGLRKFGTRGETVVISKLTQLHVMDTWTIGSTRETGTTRATIQQETDACNHKLKPRCG